MFNDEKPECWDSTCEAREGSRGITLCIHCGAELLEINGFWYHYSQFENGLLKSPESPQNIVK